MADSKKPAHTIVTGIQPSGELHIGNYAGALRNWLDLQSQSNARRFYFIADYHSLSEDYDPKEKKAQVMDLAASILALGIDPAKSTLFVQSDVPEHTELCWIFNTITPMSFLERMTQYKDKASRQHKNINVGLFTYPVLQAADILIYHGDQVPVGRDQLQHLELTRDIAGFFNNRFGKTFAEPKPLLTETPKIRSLNDPLKKMSKSLGPKSYLALADEPDVLYRKLRSAVTETTGIIRLSEEELEHKLSIHEEAHADEADLRGAAGVWNLLTLLKICGHEKEAKRILATQPMKYGELKRLVSERVGDHFADFRKKRAKLLKDPAHIKKVLAAGAKKAGVEARKTLKVVKKKIGVN